MAATVAFNGFGRVSAADSITGWTALKIAGTGGGPTAAAADGVIEGSGAVDATVSRQHVALYFDIGSGNELDFSGGGTEEGELIYIWGNFLAPGLLNALASGGFGVFLESSTPGTGQYHEWYFYGSDNYDGGWKRLVIDPTKTASASAGTAINTAAIRYFGIFADVGGTTAKFANLVCDAIDVGTGLTVTGTSTTDALIADLLADEATNRYGIVKSLNDSDTAVALQGNLVLGDVTAATSSTLSDVSAKLFLEEPIYYQAGNKAAVPLDYASITCVGGTGTNSIIIGKAVGSDAGRSGWTVVGNDTYNLAMDFDNGSVNTSEWYGCNFENITGAITWGTNTAHKCFSNNFSGCNTFDPTGGVQIRNCNFASVYDDGTADASNRSALLWNDSIDIQKSNFLANSHSSSDVAHGIEHTSTTGDATGTVTTADATGVTLHDTAASFTSTAAVNDIVFNETDGSSAVVVTVDSNIQITTDGLTGGTGDDFGGSDAYSVVTPISYTDLVFSGNEADIHNNKAGANGLAISKSGTSNPSTSTGQTLIQGSVTVEITIVDSANSPIQDAQTAVYLSSNGAEILNADTNASGVATTTYAGTTPVNILVRVRKSSSGTRYINASTTGVIASGTGFSTTITLLQDSIA